jgi:tetratricopeptide (TPR) repeat protein
MDRVGDALSVQVLISILVLLAVVSFIGFIWQVYVLKAVKNQGRRRNANAKQKRETDTRQLSPGDKKIYLQAQDLLNSGRPPQAAQLLESIQMQREAITILENAGLIHEAARILMRMGKHNRAGVVYARHGYWERAADSFKMAEMPLEVAKCAKESGNFIMAAEYFLKANRPGDAGRMLIEAGEHRNAAKYLAEGQEIDLAMKEYKTFLQENKSDSMVFDTNELKAMTGWLGAGNYDREIARIVACTGRAKELVLSFAKQGKSEEGADAYRLSKEDLSSTLLSEVDYENPIMWEELAKIFILNGLFEKAGVIFERKGLFERAAVAFEKGENRERAAYCYERAGMTGKATALKSNIPVSLSSLQLPTFPKKSQKPFSMSVLTEFLDTDPPVPETSEDIEVDSEELGTRILDIPKPPPSNSASTQNFRSVPHEQEDEPDNEDSDMSDSETWNVGNGHEREESSYDPVGSASFSDIEVRKPSEPKKSFGSTSQIFVEATEETVVHPVSTDNLPSTTQNQGPPALPNSESVSQSVGVEPPGTAKVEPRYLQIERSLCWCPGNYHCRYEVRIRR